MEKRIIKFRYWDSFNGEMVTRDWTSKFFELYEMACSGDNKPILMQYTGICDKSQTELYEGDIVEFVSVNEIAQFKAYGIISFDHQHAGYIIKWKRHGKNYYRRFNITYGDGDLFMDDSLKRIGNLYEHPHLMKQEIK